MAEFERESVADALERAIAAADHLTARHAGAVAAARALAEKIDAWQIIVEWALDDAAANDRRPAVPANDNVSLPSFLKYLDEDSGEMARQTAALLEQHVGDKVPFMWVFDCFASYAGLREALAPEIDPPLTIGDLLINPEKPPERIRAVPLLLLRKKQEIPLPAETTRLLSGDRILFAGQRGEKELQRRFLLEPSPLTYVRTGVEPPRSWLFRRLLQHDGD